MVGEHERGGGRAALVGRGQDCAVLSELLGAVREGVSKTLILVGEAGIGKTRLLEFAVEASADLRVTHVAGVESERLLAFAGLHRLLLPFLGQVQALPERQRDALLGAFGVAPAIAADRFLVGLGTLTLLAHVATSKPLIAVIDDAHWMDLESLDVLAFVARRLDVDSVGLLLGLRDDQGGPLAALEGLPIRRVEGLGLAPAKQLLAGLSGEAMQERVAARVVAETAGNPLALIELSRELSGEQLTGRAGLPVPLPTGPRLEAHFLRQARGLDARTQQLVLLASVAPPDDPGVLWRAARSWGLSFTDADAAVSARILELDPAVRFRHPLIRSAVYGAAAAADRHRAHAELAAATDRDTDPERRVWHLAAAANGPDEAVALELQRTGERASSRGGYAAQAALLLRSAELTPEAKHKAHRLFAAAEAQLVAGDRVAAQTLLDQAAPRLTGPVNTARIVRLRAAITMASARYPAVPSILLQAARTLAPSEQQLARDMLLNALTMSLMSRRATVATTPAEIAAVVLQWPRSAAGPDRVQDLMLDALAVRLVKGPGPAAPLLRDVVTALAGEGELGESSNSLALLACLAADEVWDHRRQAMLERIETFDRQHGAPNGLRITVLGLASSDLSAGRFQDAEARYREAEEITEALKMPPEGDINRVELLAWQGEEVRTRAAAEVLMRVWCEQFGIWIMAYQAQNALTVLELSLGHYPQALEQARPAFQEDAPGLSNRMLPNLIEAAVRADDRGAAQAGLSRLTDHAHASGTPWALALLARCRAMLADEDHAEELYRESLALFTRTPMATEMARTHLIYGEWLRRRKRRADARTQLRAAYELFSGMGATLFAERARLELEATGEKARSRTVAAALDLTPKERQIAGLAARGLTNSEIATQLFITASTVEYHMNKIFRKLELTSRRQLAQALRKG